MSLLKMFIRIKTQSNVQLSELLFFNSGQIIGSRYIASNTTLIYGKPNYFILHKQLLLVNQNTSSTHTRTQLITNSSNYTHTPLITTPSTLTDVIDDHLIHPHTFVVDYQPIIDVHLIHPYTYVVDYQPIHPLTHVTDDLLIHPHTFVIIDPLTHPHTYVVDDTSTHRYMYVIDDLLNQNEMI